MAKIYMFESSISLGTSLQILMKRALEFLNNLFKAIDFLVLFYQEKRTNAKGVM